MQQGPTLVQHHGYQRPPHPLPGGQQDYRRVQTGVVGLAPAEHLPEEAGPGHRVHCSAPGQHALHGHCPHHSRSVKYIFYNFQPNIAGIANDKSQTRQ